MLTRSATIFLTPLKKRHCLLLVGLLLLQSYSLIGQDLSIMVRLNCENGNHRGATVVLMANDSIVNQFVPLKKKMTINLKFGKQYVLKFEKSGYISKEIEISTENVPKHMRNEYLDFGFQVTLLEDVETSPLDIFNQPVASWFYHIDQGEFSYNLNYSIGATSMISPN